MNRSGAAIGKLLTKYSIQPESSGLFSERKVLAALHANMDKRKTKVTLPDDEVANTMSDLRAGDTIVRRVLRSEGHETGKNIVFNDVRLADGIVKVLRQHQDYEAAKGNLVSKDKTAKHFVSIFSNIRKELVAIPAKYGAQVAAALGVPVEKADEVLTDLVRQFLTGMSGSVAPDRETRD